MLRCRARRRRVAIYDFGPPLPKAVADPEPARPRLAHRHQRHSDGMLLVRVRPQMTAPAAGLNQPAFVGTVNAICFFAGRHANASGCDNTTNSSRKQIDAPW